MEQELDMIIGKPTKSQFENNWSVKYVPAVLLYASSSVKTNVKKLIDGIESNGIYLLILTMLADSSHFHFIQDLRKKRRKLY